MGIYGMFCNAFLYMEVQEHRRTAAVNILYIVCEINSLDPSRLELNPSSIHTCFYPIRTMAGWLQCVCACWPFMDQIETRRDSKESVTSKRLLLY
jgi:hypothetical protein